MAYNFSFVIPGKLAGMAFPGFEGDLEKDIDFLLSQNIKTIVNLTRHCHNEKLLKEKGIECKNIPVRDFCPPTLEQIEDFVHFVDTSIKAKKPVVVHCQMGQGRTGTMLACYLVHLGKSPADAIEEIRMVRPHSIETAQQEKAVIDFSKSKTGK